jgi:hypothetical protein
MNKLLIPSFLLFVDKKQRKPNMCLPRMQSTFCIQNRQSSAPTQTFFVGPRRLMFHSKFVIRCFGFGIEKHVEISTLVQNSNFHYSFGCIGNLIFAWSSKNGHFHIMNNCNKFKLLAEKRYFWQTNFRLEPNFHTISITF